MFSDNAVLSLAEPPLLFTHQWEGFTPGLIGQEDWPWPLWRICCEGLTPWSRTRLSGTQVPSKSTPECVAHRGGGVVLQHWSEAVHSVCWLWGPPGGCRQGSAATCALSRATQQGSADDCCLCCDAHLCPQDLLLRFQYSNTHTHGLQMSCGGKGTAQPLSEEESTSQCLGHSLKGGGPRALG